MTTAYEDAFVHCQEAHKIQAVQLKRQAKEERYSLADMDKGMDLLIAGRSTATGVKVTNNTALNCVPYFAGVRTIAETMGQVPLIEYRRLQPRGKERATDRRLYYLLHDEPNPEMSIQTFKETLQGHLITWGNAFAEIDWDMDTGIPIALWPLRPDRMQVGRDSLTKELIYAYRLPDGTTARLPAWRVWHAPGFGFDGIIGYDTVSLAREAIGMALAMEEFGARFFGNGANPGGVLQHPNKLSKESEANLRNSWNEMHQGLSNQHRIAVLEEGMTYHQVGIPPDNAQFFESRHFQIEEIARLLNLPPHMLRELSHATFSNIEHQGIEYVTYTMEPFFVRWAQTCNRKLLTPDEKRWYFFEALSLSLLRGDSAARAAYFRERFYLGSLSPNDIREYENENPIADPHGDEYYIQQNMLPMSMVGKVPPQPQLPATTRSSFEVLFQDAARRVAEREKQNILRQARKNPDGLRDWLPEFYRDFRSYIAGQVEPVVRACAETAGPLNKEAWVEERTQLLVSRYIEQSRRDIEVLPVPNLETLLGSWESQRQFTLTGVL